MSEQRNVRNNPRRKNRHARQGRSDISKDALNNFLIRAGEILKILLIKLKALLLFLLVRAKELLAFLLVKAGEVLPPLIDRLKKFLSRIPLRIRAVLGVLAVLILFSGFYSKILHRNTWLNHTTVNGIDVSGKTVDQTMTALPDGHDYSLTIRARENGTMTILADDIDYQIRPDQEQIQETLKKQHKLIVFPWSRYNYTVRSKDGYDKELLNGTLRQCPLIKGSKDYPITQPEPADIVYSEKQKMPVVKKEIYGNALVPEEFTRIVTEAIEKGETEVNLEDASLYPDVYQKPKVTSDSKEIKDGLKAYKSVINRFITWDIWEGETYTLTPEKIIPLVYYSEGKMLIRIYKLEKILHKFCDKYQTAGKPRVFTTHKGKKVTVKKGDYGWKMDFDKILDQAETAIVKEMNEEAVERYIAIPSEANKEAVTIHLEPQYKTEAFAKDYKNYQDWDPDNYTEASIDEQMVYVHRDGKIAYTCKTISGLPVEGRETGKGVYYVKGRSPDRVLRGENYETPVKYWVRLTNSGTGFHAAPWQKWDKWSPKYYKKHGSHGCLNLSDKDAKKMFEILLKGEAVFIY